MTLLTIPHELVERILLLLTTESVQTCRLVNRAFNEIIQSSVLLQYFQACEVAGVIDNPRSPLSYPRRLEILKKREDAWKKLKPAFETTIKFNHRPSSLCGLSHLTEGVYFLGDDQTQDLHYCQLPSSPQDDPRWIRLPCQGTEKGLLVNFTTAVYEHDLIVISSETGNQDDSVQQYTLDLVLLKFSTGEYHPLARQPRIHVQTSLEEDLCRVGVGICGDNLVSVVHRNRYLNPTCPDKLFVFDWKTGHKRLEHEGNDHPYSDFAFISPELLLVPNLTHAHFEVWHIPIHPESPVQILCLQIPDVSSDNALVNITCGGGLNPFLQPMPYFPPQPFFPCPESSIIIANVRLFSHPHPYVGESSYLSFTLIMHRRALINTIKKWISGSLELEDKEDIRKWFKNGLVVHKIADPDDESVIRLCAYSEATGSDSPGFQVLGSCTKSRYKFPRVKWAGWGPPISRWSQLHEYQGRWIVNSVGQRCAFWEPDLERTDLRISVVDFNPHNVRRHKKIMKRLGRRSQDKRDSEVTGDEEEKEEQDFERLLDGGAFSEDVYMGLKCVVYRAPDKYDFDLVLMDGERLLGLKLDYASEDWNVERINILYFG